jgi:hypothetical protein
MQQLLRWKSSKYYIFWVCVLIFSTTFAWKICHSKKNWARYVKKKCIGLHVKYPFFLSDCNENWIFSTEFFEKYSHIKLHENPSRESRVLCGRPDRRTDMTKLIVAFRNFANAHEKDFMCVVHWLHVLVFHLFASNSPHIIFRLH